MNYIKVFLILNCITRLIVCDAYRILGVFPFAGKSHNIIFESLMKSLAKHGHQVDVVTHFPLTEPTKNYNDIINLNGTMENLVNNYTVEFINQISGEIVDLIALSYGNRICDFMGLPEMQKLIKGPRKNSSYDVVITELFGANCYIGLGRAFKVPVVALSSAIEYPWVAHLIGNDDNLAYVPNAYHIGVGRMNWWERLNNVYSHYKALHRFHSLTEESQTESMRKYISPQMPSIREVEREISLVLVNSHPILFGVKPLIPGLVQIAGLHVEESDEVLPQKNESTEGVVYFTLGSMVLIETLPTNTLKQIYKSFEKLAPMRVLVKIVNRSNLPPGLPKNVKVLPWIPQQPVLAHKSMRIFITHGGLGGLIEALYYGVPMIGIPLFSDQFRNVEAFVAKRMMIPIKLNEINERNLDNAFNCLINDITYKNQAIYYSKLFKDRPVSSMNNAIFWIEYVIRNGNVLRSSALDFYWWQLALLDIYGPMFVLSCIAIFGNFLIIYNLFFKNSNLGAENGQYDEKSYSIIKTKIY
uniref:UDP-glucuronosyltransferase n=1 Tax=Trichogramma kaykai TaxID=54128 RepID=A0ABD2WSR0_9HYME